MNIASQISAISVVSIEPGAETERYHRFDVAENATLGAERKRIAQALHDELGQLLAALGMDLAAAKKMSPEQHDLQVLIQRMEALTLRAIGEMRRIIASLRPQQLNDLGIAAALPALLQEWSMHAGMPGTFANDGDLNVLSEAAQLVLYRTLQESLTNVLKHANARSVAVSLTADDGTVRLRICDDGVGFDAKAPRIHDSLGLRGMAERAMALSGNVLVESTSGVGTTIEVTLPLN